jgi:hypothetical protein
LESSPVENSGRFSSDQEEEKIATSSDLHERKKMVFFETQSLAEVYAKQGHVSMALEIYRKILKRNPSDVEIEKRISELEAHLFTRRGIKTKEQNK